MMRVGNATFTTGLERNILFKNLITSISTPWMAGSLCHHL